ncbi:hypothetical protein HA402_003517 [Bradysia odoriphaga]|nr:hypothetical protein HA402_003517 [Bradysia odoriphaga]
MKNTYGSKRKASELLLPSDIKKKKVFVDSTEKLLNSDRCVQAILKYLPIEDLANVSMASHFLKMNANIVFQTFHDASIDVYYDEVDPDDFHLVFRRFGSLATKVKVTALYGDDDEDIFQGDGNKVLRIIGHFCGTNLKDLTLSRVEIDLSKSRSSKRHREVRHLLGKLRKLTLINVCVRSRLLRYTTSLTELMILNCRMEKLPEVATLPRLKSLSIGACPHWPFIAGRKFNEFLRANPSIEKVDYHLNIVGDGHLNSICALPKLTHLDIITVNYDTELSLLLASIGKKLKKLNIRGHSKFSELQNLLPSGCDFSFEEY